MRLLATVALMACGAPKATPVVFQQPPPPNDAGVMVDAVAARGTATAPGQLTWREVQSVPVHGAAELPHQDEPAPGRTDTAKGIEGFCPPRALVFDTGDGRSVVTREPCSGATVMALRTHDGEQPIAGNVLYGVAGRWHVVPIDRDLLLMVNEGSMFQIELVDLASRTAQWVRLPSDFDRSEGVRVTVASGEVFLSGGTLPVSVPGPTGCENAPAGQGCDPVSNYKQVENKKIFALRPR